MSKSKYLVMLRIWTNEDIEQVIESALDPMIDSQSIKAYEIVKVETTE